MALELTARAEMEEKLRCLLSAGTQRTLRLIGPTKTKLLLFTGRRLSGSEAISWGLADVFSDNPEEVPALVFCSDLHPFSYS